MQKLFEKTRDLDQEIFRNIVSLRESEDLFDDLADGDPDLSAVADEAEMRIKQEIPADVLSRAFHYTTAIGYPFQTEPFMATRYGDGTYAVWYGSLELDTTIYETAYHTARDILNVEGIDDPVYRDRAVYLVHCRALLIDLAGKQQKFPRLVDHDYAFTQEIGRRLHREGHPGLLAPSARCDGTNTIIFNEAVLRNPRPHCYLSYAFDPSRREVVVERAPGEVLTTVAVGEWV